MKKPIWIGLTGGASSGKSTASKLLREKGLPVFNLDTIGKELLEKDTRVIEGLKKICGNEIMEGFEVNKRKVREILFSSPEKKREIENFLHPLIWNRFLELSNTEAEKETPAIVCEAALLIESSLNKQMQELVVLIADEKTRQQRLMLRDDISELLAKQMLHSQVDDDTRRSCATIIIENNGTLADLTQKIDKLVQEWKKKGWIIS